MTTLARSPIGAIAFDTAVYALSAYGTLVTLTSLFIATTPPCGVAWLSSIASSTGFESILSALMCFTAIEAAREKISPSSAFGPLIGRLAPTLMVSWAKALPAHSSAPAMAAAILDLSMQSLPYVARETCDLCVWCAYVPTNRGRLSTGTDERAGMRL